MTDKQRLTKEDFHSIFQDNIIGLQIWNHLYTRFVTNKQFDKDPFVHAHNAGMAEVIHYIHRRLSAELAEEQPSRREHWKLEE